MAELTGRLALVTFLWLCNLTLGFPGGSDAKEPPAVQ